MRYPVCGMMHIIDQNLPDLSGIPDFLFATFSFSGYGHRYISGSLNFIKKHFLIFLVRPFSSMYIKEPLLLIEKSSPCGSSGFPLLLSEWSFTICLTPYNHK